MASELATQSEERTPSWKHWVGHVQAIVKPEYYHSPIATVNDRYVLASSELLARNPQGWMVECSGLRLEVCVTQVSVPMEGGQMLNQDAWCALSVPNGQSGQERSNLSKLLAWSQQCQEALPTSSSKWSVAHPSLQDFSVSFIHQDEYNEKLRAGSSPATNLLDEYEALRSTIAMEFAKHDEKYDELKRAHHKGIDAMHDLKDQLLKREDAQIEKNHLFDERFLTMTQSLDGAMERIHKLEGKRCNAADEPEKYERRTRRCKCGEPHLLRKLGQREWLDSGDVAYVSHHRRYQRKTVIGWQNGFYKFKGDKQAVAAKKVFVSRLCTHCAAQIKR